MFIILWHVELLLGGDCRTAIARQQPANNRGMVLSVRSMLISYKQGNWNNWLLVGQLPAGKNVSMEAEDIVGIHHQAMTGEDTADSEDSVCAVVNCRVCELAIAI
jgi:hypothetical protein